MRTPLLMPEIGAGPAARVTLSVWLARPGDLVFEGERVVEVLTEGITFDVASPATGRLVELLAYPRDVLQTGQTLATLESEEQSS